MELTQNKLANDVLVIQYQGENLDASNVREFKALIQPLLKKHHRIVFDMQQMKFVDSSGLGALIACLRETNAQKGDFRLCSLTRSVSALFELMRMHRVFNIHETPEMGAQSFT
jgi:anti-sigma B factor antagonist